jgi:Uma2 family endonuclease
LQTDEEATMASAAFEKRFSPQEYLALERKADFKSEYYDGFITAMAGTSREHNLITLNLGREISSQLKKRPCEAYVSDMRVHVDRTGPYTYPDVVVVCGEPQFEDDEVDTLLNPTVIVEALSPTTEAYDRGKKFLHYRRLPSLREYVLVSQDKVLVERYTRQGDDWLLTELNQINDTLRLASIDCEVPLREIYAKVKLGADAATDS